MKRYYFGQFSKDSLNIGTMSLELLETIISKAKPIAIKVHNSTNKIFTLRDTKLIISIDRATNEKTWSVVKEQINSNIDYTSNVLMLNIDISPLKIRDFPGLTRYHDIRIIESTRLIFPDNCILELQSIQEHDHPVYYSCFIDNPTEQVLDIIKSVIPINLEF